MRKPQLTLSILVRVAQAFTMVTTECWDQENHEARKKEFTCRQISHTVSPFSLHHLWTHFRWAYCKKKELRWIFLIFLGCKLDYERKHITRNMWTHKLHTSRTQRSMNLLDANLLVTLNKGHRRRKEMRETSSFFCMIYSRHQVNK